MLAMRHCLCWHSSFCGGTQPLLVVHVVCFRDIITFKLQRSSHQVESKYSLFIGQLILQSSIHSGRLTGHMKAAASALLLPLETTLWRACHPYLLWALVHHRLKYIKPVLEHILHCSGETGSQHECRMSSSTQTRNRRPRCFRSLELGWIVNVDKVSGCCLQSSPAGYGLIATAYKLTSCWYKSSRSYVGFFLRSSTSLSVRGPRGCKRGRVD